MSGIVHLGVGAFFRAHAAIYLQETNNSSSEKWAVTGVSLRSPSVRDKLQAQDYSYTALELSGNESTTQTIDIIDSILVAPEDPQAVIEKMASPDTYIVSMTVTEKGYCRGSNDGELDTRNPAVIHDISQPLPRTAPGFVVRALEKRRNNGDNAFTVLSLDNLPSNGEITKNIVLEMAAQIDPELAFWINTECRFPCTMVDRIVPATTQQSIDLLLASHGINDSAMVAHEPFKQWVIEDNFVGNRKPNLAAAGAQFVNDVSPYELMKLRMLNGPHSALAYIGSLKQHITVADAMQDTAIDAFLDKLWALEIGPSLTAPQDTNLSDYANALKARFRNTAIKHQLEQIAMDGSQKLPQRILNTLFDNIAAGLPYTKLITVIAAWFAYLEACVNGSCKHSINDPLSKQLENTVKQSNNNTMLVAAFLDIDAVFSNYPVDKIVSQLIDAKQVIDDHGLDAQLGAIAK